MQKALGVVATRRYLPKASAQKVLARVFRDALDLERTDASWLRDALLEAARSDEALQVAADAWTYWRFDAPLRRQGKSAVITTIWIVQTGASVPRFVTCWVL